MASHLASAPTEILVHSELTLTEISTYYMCMFSALVPSVTRRDYREMMFIFQMQRSPAWFPRWASLVQHSQPEAAAGHFPQSKTENSVPQQPYTRI